MRRVGLDCSPRDTTVLTGKETKPNQGDHHGPMVKPRKTVIRDPIIVFPFPLSLSQMRVVVILPLTLLNVRLIRRASARAFAPCVPIAFPVRCSTVKDVFCFKASDSASAPALPIRLPLRYKVFSLRFIRRHLPKAAAPTSPAIQGGRREKGVNMFLSLPF